MAAKIQFKRIAVIGAGTMGSGIAAQIANAGLDVLLLDLAAKDENEISPAEAAIERLIKSDPPQRETRIGSLRLRTSCTSVQTKWLTRKHGSFPEGTDLWRRPGRGRACRSQWLCGGLGPCRRP